MRQKQDPPMNQIKLKTDDKQFLNRITALEQKVADLQAQLNDYITRNS